MGAAEDNLGSRVYVLESKHEELDRRQREHEEQQKAHAELLNTIATNTAVMNSTLQMLTDKVLPKVESMEKQVVQNTMITKAAMWLQYGQSLLLLCCEFAKRHRFLLCLFQHHDALRKCRFAHCCYFIHAASFHINFVGYVFDCNEISIFNILPNYTKTKRAFGRCNCWHRDWVFAWRLYSPCALDLGLRFLAPSKTG